MYRCVFPLGTQCDPLPREALKPLVNRISIQRFLRSLDYDFGLLCFTHESTDFSPPGSRAGRCRANGHHRSSLYFSTTFHINLYIAKGHSTAECRRFLKHKKDLPLELGIPFTHKASRGMETPVLLLHQRSWQYMVRISVPDAELTYLLSTQ